mmetsp:Transcript_22759/g.52645  ORF Transcript_22759/g.52645 Transcript_22759/m.52645 type:complete len:208 (-) Transcript_22759:344-967(-)
MKTQGVGVEEARTALTVSKAVLFAMKENGQSAVQAIDELTSRLSIASLLKSERTADADATSVGMTAETRSESQRPKLTPSKQKPNPAATPLDRQKIMSAPNSRKILKSKGPKGKAEPKASSKQPANPKNHRKRSIPASDTEHPKSRARRSDSVTDEVNMKIAQGTDSAPSEQNRPTIPPVARGKRSHHDSQQTQAQPALKRPRAGEV